MWEPITTTDNNQGVPFGEEHADNLSKLSEHPLCKLNLGAHPNLLVFPQDFKTHGDEIGKERIFTIDGDKLKTGNIMGFVGYNGTKVRIHSRFATDDGKDYFLHYMIQKVFAINLFDLKYDSDDESIFDFLIYLFPSFLKCALRQGLYREYRSRQYNDANVRGRIDVSRHVRQNIPFAGKIAYSTREYTSDNHVTQLVRHTIEYIATQSLGMSILCNDEETKDAVNMIVAATPTYSYHERDKVIGQNLRSASHPYFCDYLPLQRLCIEILRHEELKYGSDDDQIYGILFDGAWLWEEYLNTFLSQNGFEHPRNKLNRGGKHLFTDNSGICYPDFYRDGIVLDAKYKGYSSWDKIQNADLYQVITYMHILKLERGGFVVPKRTMTALPKGSLKGYGGQIAIYGMNVQQNADDFKGYVDKMQTAESNLLAAIDEGISKVD